MTDKDPKDMTASEQLRWAVNGEPYNGIDGNVWTYPTGKIRALAEAVTGEWPSDNEIFSTIADKIDAELDEAKKKAAHATEKPLSEVMAFYTGLNAKGAEPIGDWLDRWFLPRPRYEDGEPVRFDYDTDKLNGIEKFIFMRSGGGCCQMQDADGNICNVYPGKRVRRRPAPEALGADGLPIVVGETAYRIDRPTTEIKILYIRSYDDGSSDVVYYEGDQSLTKMCDPSLITHTPPDTQQKIDDDATMPPAEYCAVRGIDLGDDPDRATATEAMVLDLLRRQRELCKRTGGDA